MSAAWLYATWIVLVEKPLVLEFLVLKLRTGPITYLPGPLHLLLSLSLSPLRLVIAHVLRLVFALARWAGCVALHAGPTCARRFCFPALDVCVLLALV